MSGKLKHYFSQMDRLLGLDSRYKRPGYTMDMNDFIYLYILSAYSLLMLKKLGVKIDLGLELPHMMENRVLRQYIYGLQYCDCGEEEDDDYYDCDYYARQWTEMYAPYNGQLSRKNAYYEMSDFMYRYFNDIREKNGLGLWTVFSGKECAEFCSSELNLGTEYGEEDAIKKSAVYFMVSRGFAKELPSMGIDISDETEKEAVFAIENTLFISGFFAVTSARAEKIAAALKDKGIDSGPARNFMEKCNRLDSLLWRSGATIMADYTNNYDEVATRTQIIGVDSESDISFDYGEISPLLPIYIYYIEKAAEEMDRIYFGGQVLKEGTNEKQERNN